MTLRNTDLGTQPRQSESARRPKLIRVRFDDVGETLIEVLITLIVLSLCGVALIAGFGTVTIASSSYKSVATINNVIANASQDVIAELQQQSSAAFSPTCPLPTYSGLAFPGTAISGYRVSVTGVQVWNGSSFGSCTAPSTAAQLISLQATLTGSTVVLARFSVVVDSRGYAAATSITTPTTGLSASVGTAYTLPISSTVASTPGIYTESNLPPGLSVNASTGVISGTPTTASTFAGIVVTVTDNAGAVASTNAFAIRVNGGPTITVISPTSIKKAKTSALTITGTGFATGATVACTNSVTAASPTSITATQIVVNVTTPSNTGTFTCTVTRGGITSAPSQTLTITN